jgi:hypothetical protein
VSDKIEWPEYEHLALYDYDQDPIMVRVDECPRCAGIVRAENREKHEGVCWSE